MQNSASDRTDDGFDQARLAALVSELEPLLARAAELYSERDYPHVAADRLDAYIRLLDAYPPEIPYDEVGVEVAMQALLVKRGEGQAGMLRFHGAVLLRLIERNRHALLAAALPDDVKGLGLENFCRIVSLLIEGEEGDASTDGHRPPSYLHYPTDRFAKDLSAATLRLLVCGGRKLCRVKPPIGLLKTHPWSMSLYALRHGLSGAYLETHFDSNDANLRARFGEASWRQTLRSAALLMRDDPTLSGFVGHSWYYDPALKEIAPNLAHIGGIILDNGGAVFCTGPTADTTESALRGSTVRQGLAELGLYKPKRFKILWPRKAALRWLDQQPD